MERSDEGDDVDICMANPGHPVTLTVTARLRTLVDVLMGDARLTDALRPGLVVVDGERELARRFGALFEFDGAESFAGGEPRGRTSRVAALLHQGSR